MPQSRASGRASRAPRRCQTAQAELELLALFGREELLERLELLERVELLDRLELLLERELLELVGGPELIELLELDCFGRPTSVMDEEAESEEDDEDGDMAMLCSGVRSRPPDTFPRPLPRCPRLVPAARWGGGDRFHL